MTINSSGKVTVGETVSSEIMPYGTSVDLGNVYIGDSSIESNKLLRGWKYFYDDGENIYLIYDYYLENNKIPTSLINGISLDGYNVAILGSGKTRDNLVAYLSDNSISNNMSTSGIWGGFAEGVRNALIAKGLSTSIEVKATGSPTVIQFQASYDTMYPEDNFIAEYRNENEAIDGANGTKVNASCCVYKAGMENWDYYYILGKTNKLLYFPEVTYSNIRDDNSLIEQSNDTYGYWLIRIFS